jgi:ATP-binding cassette, subfamily B (MDR/TAP), member 1
VSFSYPSNPTQLALDSATFLFPAGQTTFVVGRSGSGKSTLGNLLVKLYAPTRGTIFIDGCPTQTLDLDWIRVNVSLVQQQSVLFNESIFLNIAFGRPDYKMVTKELVQMACQTALLQNTINDLPEGLETVVGSDNNLLSGGQVQRVAIARARLRDAPILILDEATSAMDPTTRPLAMEAIRKWREGRTTIIITHDSSQIQGSDYLYVLEHGRIVQEGYRYELEMDVEGSFASSLRGTPHECFFPDSVKPSCGRVYTRGDSKISDAGLVHNNTSDSTWDGESRNHWSRISQVFSVGVQNSIPQTIGQRASYGLGMASAYANALRAENAWLTPEDNPHQIAQISLSKPLPPLPHERLSAAGGDLSLAGMPTSLEPIEIRRHNSTRNRGKEAKLERSKMAAETPQKDKALPDKALSELNYFRSQSREFDVTPEQERKASSLADILKTVWPSLLWKGRVTLILGFVFAFISAAATPAFSYVLTRLLSTLSITSGQAEEARKWGFSILGVAVADGFCTYFWRYCFENAGQHWVDNLRLEALKRILAQPRAWFDKEKNRSSHITECLDRNVEEMRNMVGRFVGTIFMAGSMISIAIITAFVVCWKITLVAIATFPLMYGLTRIFGSVSSMWEVRLNNASDAIAEVFAETFSNISAVRTLTLEGHFRRKHTEAVQAAYKVGKKRAIYNGVIFGISDSTTNLVTAIILYYSAVIVVSRDWSIQDTVLAITLLLFSAGNVNVAITYVPQISSSRATATRVLELANMPRIASHESFGRRNLRTPLPICLNSLSFTYTSRPESEVLHQVSMTFSAGSSTAIVGSSGSGKSTIAALLFGLYPPNEPLNHHTPSLTFAGCSIFDCNLQNLREKMAVVPQTPVFFPNTIAYNIAYGLREESILGSRQNIQAAAREAGIHEFIMGLPQGYNTLIGDGGQGLSGGQAQRIAIARALVRRPMVLVLDEATSALDAESASVIRDTVVRLSSSAHSWQPGGHLRRGDMAVIIITHSVEMMKAADNIIVLDHGHVVEQGGFDELVQKGGAFARLITSNN